MSVRVSVRAWGRGGPGGLAEVDVAVLAEAGGGEAEGPLVVDVGGVAVPLVEPDVVVAVALLDHQAGRPTDLVEGLPEGSILEVEAVELVGIVDVVFDVVAGLADQLVEGVLDRLVGGLEADALGGEQGRVFEGGQQLVDAPADLGVGIGERLAEGGEDFGAGRLEGAAGLVADAVVVVAEPFDQLGDGGVGGRLGRRGVGTERRGQQ